VAQATQQHGAVVSAAEPSPRVAKLRQVLEQALTPQSLTIIDDSAAHAGHAGAREGGHFRVTIVAEAFVGQSMLQRHRHVYAAVAELMGRDIHALNIDAKTPTEL
jgi:BolA family transcriptional regulator, general stress-responsive regulator